MCSVGDSPRKQLAKTEKEMKLNGKAKYCRGGVSAKLLCTKFKFRKGRTRTPAQEEVTVLSSAPRPRWLLVTLRMDADAEHR